MVEFLTSVLLFSILVGVLAAVYREVLAYQPIMSWWFAWGNRFEKRWFFAPIWGCVKCIAGQLALWSFILVILLPLLTHWGARSAWIGKTLALTTGGTLAGLVFALFTSIAGAIFTAMMAARVISKLENR